MSDEVDYQSSDSIWARSHNRQRTTLVAEIKRKFILERQCAGIEAAKAAGIYAGNGRPISVPEAEIRWRHKAGEGPTAIARALGISRRTFYQALELSRAETDAD